MLYHYLIHNVRYSDVSSPLTYYSILLSNLLTGLNIFVYYTLLSIMIYLILTKISLQRFSFQILEYNRKLMQHFSIAFHYS